MASSPPPEEEHRPAPDAPPPLSDHDKRLWTHPWDPHLPLSPRRLSIPAPFSTSFFEGWYSRLSDFDRGVSVASIMASNYVTGQTFVALLFSFAHSPPSSSFDARRTYHVCEFSKDSHFTRLKSPLGSNEAGHEVQGFEWRSSNLGTITIRPHETLMDLTVDGVHFKSHSFNEVPWDTRDSKKGPEGWAATVKFLPTRWYIYSLGSEATYELSHDQKKLHVQGSGFVHQEKNWGQMFPSGHVWFQGVSADNKYQIVGSLAFFNLGCGLTSPYLYAIGFRSPNVQLDLRSIDLGVMIRDVVVSPEEGKASMRVIGVSHTLQIKCSAPPDTFSDFILCPVSKLSLKPGCSESFFATLEVDIFKHKPWCFIGHSTLVEHHVFNFAALEFGEEWLMQESFHKN